MSNLDIFKDERVVMTLDAGGTNFVFSAIKKASQLVEPINKMSNADNLDLCLQTIIDGFSQVLSLLNEKPVAISFAFPGPADYRNGIIGDLNNLPAFRGGVALADMLEEHFNIPVFINNDGDLYAYGEAIGGLLPEINNKLKSIGSQRQYKNIIGLTLGTGFGAGIVHDSTLIEGDNSISAEVWNIANSISPDSNIEEGVSTRAIINKYKELSNTEEDLMPKDIFDIAKAYREGNKEAALQSYEIFGTHLGDAISTLIMLFDSSVVIGGGISAAHSLYMPAALRVIRGKFKNNQSRIVHELYSWNDKLEREEFLLPSHKDIIVPYSNKIVKYEHIRKLAISTSTLGASKAISIGAYSYALNMLNNK